MKRNSRLALAAGVVAVMVVLVAVFGYRERPGTAAGVDTPWLPELKQQLAEVRRVKLQSSSEAATLLRRDSAWVVEERAGYAADFAQLEKLLQALADARLVEQKTAKPEFFDRLGLSDIEKPDSEAVQLEIWAAGEEPLVRVLLGKTAEGRGGRYVRAVSQQQTWLIDTAPDPMTSPADWLDRKLLGVDFSRVATVGRTLNGKAEFSASRTTAADDASLVPQSLPPGKVVRYVSVFDAAARSLLTAEPEDVRKAAELDFSGAAETAIGCFDGLGITARAIKGKDGNWVVLGASAGPARARNDATPAAGGEVAPAPEAKAPSADEVKAEAERLNSRLEGWAFKVSDYVYGELSKGLADYVQDEKPAAAEAPDAKSAKQ